MANLEKVKIKMPEMKSNRFSLNCSHVTSADFMRLQPVYYRHMIPGQSLDVNYNQFTRLAPLAVPAMGSLKMNVSAFFVPFRTVFPKFDNFITQTIGNDATNSSQVTDSPSVTNAELLGCLASQDCAYAIDNSLPADFVIRISGINTSMRFTRLGQHAYKLICALGYRINFSMDDTTTVYSALPLLSWIKVYLDWYCASQYVDTNGYQSLSRLLEYNDPTGRLTLSQLDILNIITFSYNVCYDTDYLVNCAWDNPVAPSSGEYNSLVFNDPTVTTQTGSSFTNYNEIKQSPLNGTPIIARPNNTSSLTNLTEFSLDALHALSDFTVRHRMVGAYAIDRMLADFGVQLRSEALRRSIYLGSKVEDIQIGAVMSQANTGSNGSPLGDYAGAGVGKGENSFQYTSQDFGMFIIAISIIPNGTTVQGLDRNNLHLTRDEFFDHNFDNLGVQVMSKAEVFMPERGDWWFQSDGLTPYNPLSTYGFVPRYAEYKVARSWLSGNPNLAHLQGEDAWHLFRLFTIRKSGQDGNFETPADIIHSLSIVRGDDSGQYNRIFVDTLDDIDKFYIAFNFGVTSYMPAKSLFETYNFHQLGGKEITMDSQGAKLN